MNNVDEIIEEKKEESKSYLEGALKILGISQIAAGIADIFWYGSPNFNIYNGLIILTGFIFFVGAENMRQKYIDFLNKIDNKKQEIDEFDSKKKYLLNYEETVDDYREEKEKESLKKYEDLFK